MVKDFTYLLRSKIMYYCKCIKKVNEVLTKFANREIKTKKRWKKLKRCINLAI